MALERATDWLGWNGNVYNQRYSSLTDINVANVKRLKQAWARNLTLPGLKAKVGALGVFAEQQPIVYKGTMYMPDSSGNVWAMDATSGERIWVHRAKFPKGLTPLLPSRGVAMGDGKVYIGLGDASMSALDQSTGRQVWKNTVANWKDGYYFTNAPTYYKNMIITGISGGDSGARRLRHRAQREDGQGALALQRHPREKGRSGLLDVAEPEGVPRWRGDVEHPDGRPGARSGVRGRRKPNPVLGRDPRRRCGALHRLDHRAQPEEREASLVLPDDAPRHLGLRRDEPDRPVRPEREEGHRAGGQDRLGLHPQPVEREAAVRHPGEEGGAAQERHTYPTQPIPNGDKFSRQCATKQAYAGKKAPDGKPYQKVGCIYTPYDDTGFVAFAPAALGGANWPPSAYSPKTGYLYICSKDSESAWRAVPAEDQKLQALGDFSQIEGLTPGAGVSVPSRGRIVAMNMRNNRLVWSKKWPTSATAG